ncbi:MAG TPA: trehalose-phosphatase [Deltaproteobacteria bacterium]|nr:trehalose-phosphatase [Deltaproteobacteria bacterium]
MNHEKKTGDISITDDHSFWSLLSDAGSKFLGLDYDGTLAPFKEERMSAVPLDGIVEILEQISCRKDTVLAIISGRSLFELAELLGNIPVTMVGSHGFEFRNPLGEVVVKKLSPGQGEGLVLAQRYGIEAGLRDCLEIKRASIALHTRGISPDEASGMYDKLYPVWERYAKTHHLEARRFNGGLELRAAGWNKGDALESLLIDLPEDTFCVYIGDDETDEDAFERIQPYGIGIRVGGHCPETKARGFLEDIRSVKSFLGKWKDLVYRDR